MTDHDETLWRRGFGLLFLGGAIAMLVCGETIFEPRLDGLFFLAYWLGCLLLTGMAMFTALLDLRSTRRRTRTEQRALWENIFRPAARKNRQSLRSPDDHPPGK